MLYRTIVKKKIGLADLGKIIIKYVVKSNLSESNFMYKKKLLFILKKIYSRWINDILHDVM